MPSCRCSPRPRSKARRRMTKTSSSSPDPKQHEETMPTATAKDGCPINYQVEGPADAPALMLCNSLGTNLHMWDDQAAEWSKHFRLVRYDRRGHGKSGAPKGAYSMDMLGGDALAVAD